MLFYKIIPNKNSDKWIVLIHGLCGNSAMWTQQIFSFNKEYNVLLIDLPGHGNSKEAFNENEINSFADVAKMIIAVMDENDIKKANFAGLSMGTLVIAKLYQLYPERVNSIILCGAVVCADAVHNLLSKVLRVTSKFLNPKTLVRIWTSWILNKEDGDNVRNHFLNQSKTITKKDIVKTINMALKEYKLLLKLDYKHLKNILFIMGDNDKLCLPQIQKLKNKFSNLKLQIIENCGHVCNMQKPKEYNNCVLQFLKTV